MSMYKRLRIQFRQRLRGFVFFCDCLTQMYEKQNVEYISSFFYIVSSLKFE